MQHALRDSRPLTEPRAPHARKRSWHRAWLAAGCLACLFYVVLAIGPGASSARAQPVRAKGEASLAEWKKGGTVERARARAIRRARLAALKQAIEAAPGKHPRTDVKAVLAKGDGWTGSYRVLGATSEGGVVRVELEVEVDSARLAKRLAPNDTTKTVRADRNARWRLGRIELGAGCSEQAGVVNELRAAGLVGDRAKAAEVDVVLRCDPRGAVPHTHLMATSVSVVLRVGGKVKAQAQAPGFGADSVVAQAQALVRALDAITGELGKVRRGEVLVRVESPLPAERVRRLQHLLRESVVGVSASRVIGISSDGAVLLAVRGSLKARRLGKKLEALQPPGFTLTVAKVHADELTIRLHD